MKRLRSTILMVIPCLLWGAQAYSSGSDSAGTPANIPAVSRHDPCADTDDNLNGTERNRNLRRGNYCDDGLPLPDAVRLASAHDYGQAPQGCDSQTAVNGKKPWQQGFYDGVAGQRYVLGAAVALYDNDPRKARWSPTNPERRACMSFRDGQSAAQLQCCISGFRLGMHRLLDDITRFQTPPLRDTHGWSESDIRRMSACRDDYQAGASDGEKACARASNGNGGCLGEDAHRYLGCYNLGLLVTMQSDCHNGQETQIQQALQGIVTNATAPRHDAPLGGGNNATSSGNAGLGGNGN